MPYINILGLNLTLTLYVGSSLNIYFGNKITYLLSVFLVKRVPKVENGPPNERFDANVAFFRTIG